MLNTDTLIAALRRNAQGSPRDRAALELLIGHGVWLRRPDWLRQCIETLPEEDLDNPNEPVAWIDWNTTSKLLQERKLMGSGSEVSVLAIAASLAYHHEVLLGDAITGLDQTNTLLVVDAIKTVGQIR